MGCTWITGAGGRGRGGAGAGGPVSRPVTVSVAMQDGSEVEGRLVRGEARRHAPLTAPVTAAATTLREGGAAGQHDDQRRHEDGAAPDHFCGAFGFARLR